MKINSIISKLLMFFIILITISCTQNEIQTNDISDIKSKSQLVHDEIIKNGNFLNSIEFPPIINASEVYQNVKNDYLIIDLRKGLDYSNGHIKGAVNIKLSELIDYAQVSGFPEYEKVILVCYTGQSASYGAGILRMLGHNNVYVMEWGMCSWNKKFSSKWEKSISDDFQSKLVKKTSSKKDKTELPEIKSNKNSGAEILYLRAKQILTEGFGKGAVTIDRVIPNLSKSFEVCLMPKDLYNTGHLKGSVLYKSEDLKTSTDLLSIPNNKIIVVYSLNGHQSSFITAYLKMLGYDAKTLKYGANSFMNTKLVDESQKGFSAKHINNYPTETSVYIEEEGGVEEGGC